MARSTKSSAKSKATTKAEVKADVEDAVVLPEEDQSAEAIAEEGPAAATSKSEDAKAVSEKPVVDDTTTEAVAEDTVTETPPVDDDTTSRDDTPEPETTTAILPPPVTQDVTVQKVGFLPTLGGGVIAAGLGYFAATQGFGQNTEDLSPLLDEQSAQIEEHQRPRHVTPDARLDHLHAC